MKISKRVDVPPDSKLSWGDWLRNHALGTTFQADCYRRIRSVTGRPLCLSALVRLPMRIDQLTIYDGRIS